MKETVTSSCRGHRIEESVTNFWKASDLYVPSSFLISFVVCIVLVNMVVVSGAQLLNREIMEVVTKNNAVKLIGNLKVVIKTSGSKLVNGGR